LILRAPPPGPKLGPTAAQGLSPEQAKPSFEGLSPEAAMIDIEERRAKGAGRVAIETLVEICGNEPGIPAFEAEALDVSARGMHLRTAYLPEEGAPLVCRFEDRGREIVVEGLVAWRKESEKGGDFGVSFTALDSRSVDALKTLLRTGDGDGTEAGDQSDGSRVRLHIEGLGSPMKARVRGGSGTQKIQVGSSLEFLKVGRRLEVEDVEAGSRRAALIDGVEVLINPKTSVPQLVVALRYEGAHEDTPQPTTTDLSDRDEPAPGLRLSGDKVTTDAGSRDDADPEPSGEQPEATDEDDDDDLEAGVSAATRTARKLGNAAENAGVAARDASERAARWGASALRGLGKTLGGKIAGMRRKAPQKRRSTAPAPEGPISGEGRRLRPQSGKSEPPPAPERKRPAPKHVAIGAAAAVLLGTVGAMALRGGSNETAKAPDTATAPAAPVAAGPGAPTSPAAAAVTPSTPGAPVTANVPLFGPTPLATLEPAPLGPPPTGDGASEEALELAAAKSATPPEAEDEEFMDVPGSRGSDASKKSDASAKKPEDVAPFGNGRLHLPVISRLRLDGAGSELRGQADATGFTVLIPGRKLMEQGAALAKRDPRIARVRTTNTPGGAQVRMTFKDGVPAYRVRLRRDFVELLISAPEEKPKKASLPATPAKSAAKSLPAVKPTAAKK
jgi:hypothetical protein